MLSKAHLTSHSRMSGSRCNHTIMVIWIMMIFFFYSSSVSSCHLFLISSASVRSIVFLSFIEHFFAWNVPLVSLIFLKRSLVFPILLFSSISLHWSLRKAFLSLLAILWDSAFKWVYASFSQCGFRHPVCWWVWLCFYNVGWLAWGISALEPIGCLVGPKWQPPVD